MVAAQGLQPPHAAAQGLQPPHAAAQGLHAAQGLQDAAAHGLQALQAPQAPHVAAASHCADTAVGNTVATAKPAMPTAARIL